MPSVYRSGYLKRRLLAGLALLVAAAAIAAWWVLLRPGAPPRTVVVFLLDTVRQDALGCYGHPADPTPRIDALAAEGVRFDQAVSTSGWTLPAAASLMTGAWPTVHGAMGRDARITPIRPELPVAAEILGRDGFATVGLASAVFISPMLGFDRGFDVYDHRYSYNWDTRRADETIDAALARLRERSSEDCFYFIHLFDPHLDYDAPAEYTRRFTGGRSEPPTPVTMTAARELQTGPDRTGPPVAADIDYVRGTYEAEVAFVDAQVGRFLDELKALGLYDQATIVVTSDHGEEFWEHDGFEHGHTLYDELVLIPLVIKPPAGTPVAGPVVDARVRLLDVMPTVFDLVGAETPETFAGVSLLPYLAGETVRDLDAICESTMYGPPLIALRGERYKFIDQLVSGGAGEGLLFDLRDDPGETRNLAAELPQVAREMRLELVRLHNDSAALAGGMSSPDAVDLSQERIRQLRSLGYIR